MPDARVLAVAAVLSNLDEVWLGVTADSGVEGAPEHDQRQVGPRGRTATGMTVATPMMGGPRTFYTSERSANRRED